MLPAYHDRHLGHPVSPVNPYPPYLYGRNRAAKNTTVRAPDFHRGFSPARGIRVWDHVKDRVADYLAEYGRPEQIAAWRDGQPYVAELAENSAGR